MSSKFHWAVIVCAGLLCVSSAQATTYLFDFGAESSDITDTSKSWNAMPCNQDYDGDGGTNNYRTLASFVDVGGTASTMTISRNDGFQYSRNSNCATADSETFTLAGDALAIFSGCTNYSLYDSGTNSSTITLSGLDVTSTYSLDFFASREGSGTRPSYFAVVGDETYATVSVNGYGNTSDIATVSDITAAADGTVTITVTGDGSSYFYLSAMQLTSTAVPEPATMSLVGAGVLLLLKRRHQ